MREDGEDGKMPTECTSNPLQRDLADSIIRLSPLDDLRILLACGASPNEPVTQGLRPLHYAVWQRHTEAVEFLLVRGSDVNARDDCGYSALHLSAEHGFVDIMNLLLHHQAKINFAEKKSDDGIEVRSSCEEPLRMAVKNGHLEAARLLLENGANANTRYFFGCEINLIPPQDKDFLELLLLYGAWPDSRDRTGATPLMKACRIPQAIESVLMLISHGADVNAHADERSDYRSVLHFAVLSGSPEMVQLLLKQGARPNNQISNSKPSPLDLAVLKGDIRIIEMLIRAGADVNNTSSVLGSALHIACADNVPNRCDVLKLLLENEANPNIVAKSEEGLLLQPILAEYISSNIYNLNPDVIKLLLRHGAKVVLKTQFRDPLGLIGSLPNVTKNEQIFQLILEAAQSFDLVSIKYKRNIAPDCKMQLMNLASNPLPLKHQSRLFLRDHLQRKLHLKVPRLDIPVTLQSYLLFDIS